MNRRSVDLLNLATKQMLRNFHMRLVVYRKPSSLG